jgi:cytochrome d ubiquinol oxidase subunit I
MDLDPLILSRVQFAFVIAFHFLLPAFTIGLASYIAVLEALFLWTRKPVYLRISNFWIKIFALSFGMGVVSGIVMPFQFGTNWSRYSDATANVVAPLMGYEGLTAFFLEAAFLGVLLFGRKLVPQWAHFASAFMVALGTLFSTFWIIVLNSWMQTPVGFKIVDGRFIPTDWLAILFNPSLPYRFLHTVIAVYLTTAFTVIGVAAYYLRGRRFAAESRVMLVMGLLLASVLVPLQAVIGDAHGLNTLHHQPQKLAAMEGIWEGGPGQSVVLSAIPDSAQEKNHLKSQSRNWRVWVPHPRLERRRKGAQGFSARRPSARHLVFYGFRTMIAMWSIMLALTVCGWWLAWRKRLYTSRHFLGAATCAIPVGYIAVTAGWITTEVGRQPFVVYGQLRTADAVTPFLTTGDVIASLSAYVVVYSMIFGAGAYYLVHLVRRGFPADVDAHEPMLGERPARPLSAATEHWAG